MNLHRKVFKIIDNFHSVFCRGDKTVDDATMPIKIYNLTKVITHQCSVPNEIGEKKTFALSFDLIHNIFSDI